MVTARLGRSQGDQLDNSELPFSLPAWTSERDDHILTQRGLVTLGFAAESSHMSAIQVLRRRTEPRR